MTDTLQKLAAYNAVGLSDDPGAVEDCLNARPKSLLFQNTATPTAAGVSQSAIITIGDHPWLLNCIELGSISVPGNGNSFPDSFFLEFNLYDSDNEGLFGGAAAPRASTVFGAPVQIAYAIQPVKVFKPRTKMKLSWTNRNATLTLGFELIFRGIEVPAGTPGMNDSNWENKMRDLMEEYSMEPRVR